MDSAGITRNRKPFIGNSGYFILTAFLVGAAITIWLYSQQNQYLLTHPYFYDGATYQTEHIRLANMAEQEGFFAAFLHNLNTNAKEPLRPALMLLFPSLLKNTQGYIFLLLPLLFWLFLRLQQLMFLRSGNIIQALCAITIFTSLGMVYDPVLGLGAYWLDFFAGILLACALLEYRLFTLQTQKRHLLLCGLFLALCGLSRYEAYFYSFVVMGPLLLTYWLSEKSFSLSKKLSFLLILALPLLLLSAYHITKHLQYIFDYNTKLNYGLGKTIRDSLWYTRTGLLDLSNAGFIMMLLVLPACAMVNARIKGLPISRKDILSALWICSAMPILWAFVLRICGTGANYFMLFTFPLFIAAMVGWGPVLKTKYQNALISLLLLGVLCSAQQVFACYKKMESVNPTQRNTLLIQDAIAESGIFHSGQQKNIATVYNEDLHPLYLRIYTKTGVLPATLDSLVFALHTNYYLAQYATLNPDSLTDRITAYMKRKVDYAVVLKHPQTADTSRQFTEQLPRIMAGKISASLISDSVNWNGKYTLSSQHLGELIILENTSRKPR